MDNLSEAFDKNSEFILKYYLELPQSFYATNASNLTSSQPGSSQKSSVLGNAADMDLIFFTPKKIKPAALLWNSVSQRASKSSNSSTANPNKLTSTLPKDTSEIETPSGANVKNPVNLTNGASHDESKNDSDSNEVGRGKTAHKETPDPNIPTLIRTNKSIDNSNSNFDFNVQVILSPKAAALVLENRSQSCLNQSVYTYHCTIGVLDNQQAFIDIIPAWHDMYDLSPGPTGKMTVPDRKSLRQRLDEAADAVQFRVFCYEFRKAYIRDDDAQKTSVALAISTCDKNLHRISLSYRDYITKQVITIAPDKVYQKMMEYVSLLPEDAPAWEFCLPWIYFQALTISLQEDLCDSGYSLLPLYSHLINSSPKQRKCEL